MYKPTGSWPHAGRTKDISISEQKGSMNFMTATMAKENDRSGQ